MSVLQCSNIHFDSTANNRVQYGGTNNINIVVGGTVGITFAANGDVGIGTTTPANAGGTKNLVLNSSGTSIIKTTTTNTTSGSARIDWATGSPASYAIAALVDNSGSPYWQLSVGSAVTAAYYDSPIHIWRNAAGTERMRIASNGNIGISNTTPTLKLYVNGSAAGAVGTLTDGANVAVDLSTFNNFTLTLNGARNLDNPTNLVVGQSGVIWVSQNSTGGQTLSYGSFWKFPANTAPTLTSTASAVDAIVYTVRNSTSITAQAILNVG